MRRSKYDIPNEETTRPLIYLFLKYESTSKRHVAKETEMENFSITTKINALPSSSSSSFAFLWQVLFPQLDDLDDRLERWSRNLERAVRATRSRALMRLCAVGGSLHDL